MATEASAAPRVTLLTDFGTRDGYVAAMKGVLSTLAPDAHLDDVAHDLPQGDVEAAAWTLSRYWNRYPEGTVHLVVVDPGVGTDRRALAIAVDRRYVVAPDNGVTSRVLDAAEGWSAVEIVEEAYLAADRSTTFHGRDVFAPAAGHLARGVEPSAVGPGVDDPVRIPEPSPMTEGDTIRGEVVAVDGFGNLVTNVEGDDLTPGAVVRVAGRELGVRSTYADVGAGELLALVNSSARLEVAVRDGSAALRLDAGRGLPVEVRR